MVSEERLVGPGRERADAWQSHPQTIRTLIKDGRLKAFRIRDSEWRIPAPEVERYMHDQALPPPPATPPASPEIVELHSAEASERMGDPRMLHGRDE